MHLELWQWILGALAALLIGFSKTGVPGVGILVVPVLAVVFGGRPSVGIMLPMLIFADCFAVAWYRRHAQWDKLVSLLPWVAAGLLVGAVALWKAGEIKGSKDVMGQAIGILVLVMLAIYFLQGRFGEKLAPRSKFGCASTGVSAGFSTMVSNAAGPIMSIYLSAQKMPKSEFMGTIAWYFFIINLSKVPFYVVLSRINPENPIMTVSSMLFVLMICPVIILGVFVGRWMLPRIPQKGFDVAVLILAGIAAANLIWHFV